MQSIPGSLVIYLTVYHHLSHFNSFMCVIAKQHYYIFDYEQLCNTWA